MKKKLEVDLQVKSTLAKEASVSQVIEEKIDETYHQVNQLSFQQNFKALIGHYKTGDVSLSI